MKSWTVEPLIDLGLNVGHEGTNWIAYKPQKDMWECSEGEVNLKYFILDYHSLKSGWGKIAPGISPSWMWDERLGVHLPRPGDLPEEQEKWKRGLSIELYIKDEGQFVLCTTTFGTLLGLEKIYHEIIIEKDNHPDLLPVIEYKGSTPNPKYNTRSPDFELTKWVKRPDEFVNHLENEVSIPVDVKKAAPDVEQFNDDIPF